MTIPNQIFIGCPWLEEIMGKYLSVREKLRRTHPISFVIVGKNKNRSADDLYSKIKSNIRASTRAVFDVSYGNPNVSLEYGFADGQNLKCDLHSYTGNPEKLTAHGEPAIITDLKGKIRNVYKEESGLEKLLRDICEEHNYTTRFDNFIRKKKYNASNRELALRIIHCLDEYSERQKHHIDLAVVPDFKQAEVNNMLKSLHAEGLIQCLGLEDSTPITIN